MSEIAVVASDTCQAGNGREDVDLISSVIVIAKIYGEKGRDHLQHNAVVTTCRVGVKVQPI
jgi:hypothetical protein